MTIRFRLQASAEAQCLSRVLDHFAQRDLVPSAMITSHVGQHLEIVIDHPTMDESTAELLCNQLLRTVSIASASSMRIS
jgi:hypothetical protein